jgi:outer membrane protein assembly factor BamB
MKNIFFLFLITLYSSCAALKDYHPVPDKVEAPKLSPVWIKDLDPVYDSGNLPIALQSPLVHEGIVYAGHNGGYMQAHELENGRPIWSEYDASAYHSGAVSFNDQIIYGTVQGRVISRHGIMGTIKYSVDLGATIETRGVVYNGRIFFQTRNHQVFCLDAVTGKILWAYKRSVPYLTTLQRASTPVIFKDKVLVGFADGVMAALSIDEGLLLFETKLSNASKFVDVDNSAFIYADRIYISPVGSALSVLDPSSGKVLKVADFVASRAPVVRDDQLIFGTPYGEILLTDKNLNVLSTIKISKGAVTGIVPIKNYYAISTSAGEIKLISQKTLEVVDTFKLGHAYSAVFGEMTSSGDYLSLISSRNRLYVFNVR